MNDHETHWLPRGEAETACGLPRGTVCYAEYWSDHVDCLVCMHHLGLYVPLTWLRQHQHRYMLTITSPTRAPAMYGVNVRVPGTSEWPMVQA